MSQVELLEYVNNQINLNVQRILDKGDMTDEISTGKLFFYTSLREVLTGNC